jgi:hypothetical protein
VTKDAHTGTVTLWILGHADTPTVTESIVELVHLLQERGRPTRIVADLLDVVSFDVDAPVAAARLAAPVVPLIEHVEIIARRRLIRIAALSAAHLIGLSCSVRSER